jgi:hypothetical protein
MKHLNSGGAANMNKLTQTLRSGLMATSLSAALVLGGAVIASAQNPSHEQASPATQQTAPDSSAKPMSEQPNMGGQQATPQDRDTMGQQPTTTPDNDQTSRKDRDRQDRDKNRDRSKNAKNDNDITNREVVNFDQFLDKHPQVAQELRQDPQKVNDQSWVSSHKDLEKFLSKHPKLREELKENPQAVLNRENRREQNESRPQ